MDLLSFVSEFLNADETARFLRMFVLASSASHPLPNVAAALCDHKEERYGYAKDQIKKEVDDWYNNQRW